MSPVIFAASVVPATFTETFLRSGRSKHWLRPRFRGKVQWDLLLLHTFAGDNDAFAAAVVEHDLDKLVRVVGGPEHKEAVFVPAIAADALERKGEAPVVSARGAFLIAKPNAVASRAKDAAALGGFDRGVDQVEDTEIHRFDGQSRCCSVSESAVGSRLGPFLFARLDDGGFEGVDFRQVDHRQRGEGRVVAHATVPETRGVENAAGRQEVGSATRAHGIEVQPGLRSGSQTPRSPRFDRSAGCRCR